MVKLENVQNTKKDHFSNQRYFPYVVNEKQNKTKKVIHYKWEP